MKESHGKLKTQTMCLYIQEIFLRHLLWDVEVVDSTLYLASYYCKGWESKYLALTLPSHFT